MPPSGSQLATTATTDMLSFLARLSGRRRHVRRFRSCAAAAAGSGPGASPAAGIIQRQQQQQQSTAAPLAAATAAATAAMDPERPERPQQPRVAPDSRERATETEYCCSASSSSTQYCSSSSSSRCSLCCSCSCAFTSGSSSGGGIVIAAEQQRPTGGSAQQETARKDDVILVDEELESQLDMDEEEEEAAQQQQSHRPARHSEQPDDRHSTSAYAERRASTTRRDCGCKDDRDVLCRRPASNDRPNLQRQQQLLQKPQKQRQRHRLATQAVRLASKASSRLGSLLPSYLATLLILSCSFVGVADACSSRSTPKPRPPTPTPRPNITFHMYSCPHDYAEWYCLNGATCFTVKIVESLLYNCLCAEGYIGQRCEFKDLDGSYLPTRQRIMLETASIAGAVTIAVFLAVITFISVYIHCKRKQKELRMSSGVDAVDGPGRDPELRPFCSRSRSLMIFMAKNPNSSTTAPSIEQTRMPNWNFPAESSTRVASVNENKRPSQ